MNMLRQAVRSAARGPGGGALGHTHSASATSNGDERSLTIALSAGGIDAAVDTDGLDVQVSLCA